MSAREEIASRLWLSVPSRDDDEAQALSGQMLDAFRADTLREAGWVPCSPEWLAAHPGECDAAPRLPGDQTVSHWHPAASPVEEWLRRRIAQDVNRARRPVFAAGESTELVVRTTRAIDIRLIELGPAAPYWVPEAGEPR